MVHTDKLPEQVFCSLQQSIDELTSIDATHAPFVSCYLDLEAGFESCRTFLESEAGFIRSGLDNMNRLLFDEALIRVMERLESVNVSEMRGVAIFARSIMGRRHLSVIPSILPFRNQLTFYRVPDVRPLLSLRDAYSEHVVIWAGDDGLELLRLENGDTRTLAWVSQKRLHWCQPAARHLLSANGDSGSTHRSDRFAKQIISRTLKSIGRLKLVLAGDNNTLAILKQWLPLHLLKSVEQTVALPAFYDRTRGLRQIVDQISAGSRAAIDGFARSCLRNPYIRRRYVKGPFNAFSAIQCGSLDTLLISSRPTQSLIASPYSEESSSWVTGGRSGQEIHRTQFWNPAIELSRLACRRGIRTLISNSGELFRQGGVGGVLNDSIDLGVLPMPRSPSLAELVA